MLKNKSIKFNLFLIAISFYGLLLLPYDNQLEWKQILFAFIFIILFIECTYQRVLLLIFSLVIWAIPFIHGIINFGLENATRALIPILLLIFIISKNNNIQITEKQIKTFILITSIIIIRYILLILFEVQDEISNNSILFSGSTRALVNEPLFVCYFLAGSWLIFNYQKNSQPLEIYLIKILTLIILAMSLLFQVRFFPLSFCIIAFTYSSSVKRLLILGVVVIMFLVVPKFSEITFSNGKFEEILEIFQIVNEDIYFGMGLGAMRESSGVMVRYTHSAFTTIYLYGGFVGLAWYSYIIIKIYKKYFYNFSSINLPIALAILHSQFLQPGFKMVGLISLPIFYIILRKISDVELLAKPISK